MTTLPGDDLDDTADTVGLPAAPVAAPTLAQGTLVGRFLVLELVAEGGMGSLYKAFDPQLDRAVALKMVRTRGAGPEAAMLRERLLREARALARLSHPNVVTVYEAGVFEDEVFIAMEFVVGVTFRKWLADERRSRRAIVDAFLAAGEGLAAAHRAGLVHRDVKPDNMLIGADGRARIVDFGLARGQVADGAPVSVFPPAPSGPAVAAPPSRVSAVSRPDLGMDSVSNPFATPLTELGSRMGTPRYMAPEQHLGQVATESSDQFSLCVSLYEALYRVHPFASGPKDAFVGKVTAGRVDSAPRARDVPAWLRAVLVRGLAPVPGERFPDMAALLAALRADPAIARRAWLARGAGALALVGATGVAVYVTKRPEILCRDAAREVAQSWGQEQRSAAEAAFAGSGLSYAAEALAGVEHALDTYAAEWGTAAGAMCVAREARRVTPERSEATSACLAERLVELRALTHALSRADKAIASRALSAALALPAPAACASPTHAAGTPPPRDPAVRARVLALEQRRAEASALADLGKLDEAKGALEQLLPDAEATAHEALIADVLFDLGRVYEYALDYAKAESTLERGINVADSARQDTTRAMARISLVRLAYSQSHYDAALVNAERALAVVRRLGDEPLEAQLLMQRGWARIFAGQADAAAVDAREGLALATRAIGPRAPLTAELHSLLGSAAGELSHADEAERESREALAISEALFSENHERTARMAENLSLVLGYAGKYAEARALQERAVAISTRLFGAESINTAIKMQNLGGLLVEMNAYRDAIPVLERAAAILETDPGERDAQWMAYTLSALGEAYLGEKMPERARPPLERAVAIVVKSGLDPDVAGESRFRLAQTLVALKGDEARARSLAETAAAELRKVPRLQKSAEEAEAWVRARESAPRSVR